MFGYKAIKCARIFVNRLLHQLRLSHMNRYIPVTSDMKRDLNWFLNFAEKYNGKTLYVLEDIFSEHVQLDASLSGMGAVFGNKVYTVSFIGVAVVQEMSIFVHFEMWNILIVCRVWAKSWKGNHVHIQCDNMAVVEILNKGHTTDMILAAITRNIWLDLGDFVTHIAGGNNGTADLLSSWDVTKNNYEKLLKVVLKPDCCIVCDKHVLIDFV